MPSRLQRAAASATLALTLAVSPSTMAFSSLEFFGGAYHTRITEAGLKPQGFSKESLHWIALGNISMDKFYTDEFSDDRRHFTDMTFDESEDFLEDKFEEIVEGAGRAREDYQVYRQTLIDLGEFLHTVQDFYAHTNWIEKSLSMNPDSPVELAPDDFDDYPFSVISPYTLNNYLPPGEVTNPENYQRAFGHGFYSVEELAAMSPRERIEATANPSKGLSHLNLAKDNPEYAAGALRWVEGGPTLFDMAVSLATRDTARQWGLIEEELEDEFGARGKTIAKLLKEGWPSSFPADPKGAEPISIALEDGELRLSNDLELTVRLTLRPSRWSQKGARESMKLFTRLTRPDSQSHRFNSEGVSGLKMERDDEGKTFRVGFQANLYGSSRTLVKLSPLGDGSGRGQWEAVVTIPHELEQVRRLLFHSRGDVRLTEVSAIAVPNGTNLAPRLLAGGRLRLVLDPPKGGWHPPSWLREYLQGDSSKPARAPRK